jgi:hypothetical protein
VVEQVKHVTSSIQRESEGIVAEMRAAKSVLDVDKLTASIMEQNKALISRHTAELKTELVEIVRREVGQAVRDQSAVMTAAVLRSAASTPLPMAQSTPNHGVTEEQLVDLVKSGHACEAFQRALRARNVRLVEFLLSRVDFNKVIAGNLLDPQTLMALIQQLSVSFDSRTDMKINALQIALSAIDVGDGLLRDKVPPVAETLRHELQNYVRSHGDSPRIPSVRILLMAVDSLLARTRG